MRYRSSVFFIAFIAVVACANAIRVSNHAGAAYSNNNVSAQTAATPVVPSAAVAENNFTDEEFDGKVIVKTNEEWKSILTPAAYNVIREEGTEVPNTGELLHNHIHGVYYCAACGLALFRSEAKFESGTGWPSFFEPIYKKNVVERTDKSFGVERTEIECSRCHGHLGHVFDDGPKPTGLRYCMNSVSLKFRETK